VRLRILVSIAIGLASGSFCWLLLSHFDLRAADFGWAIQAARDLLAHKNPYQNPQQLYPLTVAFFGLPFVWIKPDLAAGIFYGISSALLAFGLTKDAYHRLLIFLAYPYWAGILTAQWMPLVMASCFFPLLLPATMAKPQIGLPVALTNLTWRGLLLSFVVLLLSLLWLPQWPFYWLVNTHHYSRFIPMFVLPGPLLALALVKYRDRDARLLLLMGIMPQRWFYDAFVLWLIPKTRREIVWTVGLSWIPGIWRWYHIPHSFTEVGRWAVIFMYLPILAIILQRFRKSKTTEFS